MLADDNGFVVVPNYEAGVGSHNCYEIQLRAVKPNSGGWVLMTKRHAEQVAAMLNEFLEMAQDHSRSYEDTVAINLFVNLREQLYANGTARED